MQKTDEEVNRAYDVARKLAKACMRHMLFNNKTVFHIDEEDLVQEGMIAWLTGESNMYARMVRVIRDAKMGSRYQYDQKGLSDINVFPIESFPEDTSVDEEAEDRMLDHIDAKPLLERIERIPNKDARLALTAYLMYDVSLRELGELFEKSHEWVRKHLIQPELKKIREEFNR